MFMMTSQVVCTREWDANGSSGVDELITNGFHCIYKPANTLVWGGGGGGGTPYNGLYEEAPFKRDFSFRL